MSALEDLRSELRTAPALLFRPEADGAFPAAAVLTAGPLSHNIDGVMAEW